MDMYFADGRCCAIEASAEIDQLRLLVFTLFSKMIFARAGITNPSGAYSTKVLELFQKFHGYDTLKLIYMNDT